MQLRLISSSCESARFVHAQKPFGLLKYYNVSSITKRFCEHTQSCTYVHIYQAHCKYIRQLREGYPGAFTKWIVVFVSTSAGALTYLIIGRLDLEDKSYPLKYLQQNHFWICLYVVMSVSRFVLYTSCHTAGECCTIIAASDFWSIPINIFCCTRIP